MQAAVELPEPFFSSAVQGMRQDTVQPCLVCNCHITSTDCLASLLTSRSLLGKAQALIEAPCYGVPGLCTYMSARSGWVKSEIAAAISAGATQVVLLGSGFDTRGYRFMSAAVTVRAA